MLITVGRFSKPEEAHLLRMKLGAGGVEAFLRDEYTTQIYWLYSDALGGVKVEIREEDAERAREILAADKEDPMPNPCPACDSGSTRPDETGRRLSFLSVLLFSVPLPVNHSRFVCRECGHRWKE